MLSTCSIEDIEHYTEISQLWLNSLPLPDISATVKVCCSYARTATASGLISQALMLVNTENLKAAMVMFENPFCPCMDTPANLQPLVVVDHLLTETAQKAEAASRRQWLVVSGE